MLALLLAGVLTLQSVPRALPVAANETFEALIRLPSGNFQKVQISAGSNQNAQEMLYLQFCPQKKNCIVTGPNRIQ